MGTACNDNADSMCPAMACLPTSQLRPPVQPVTTLWCLPCCRCCPPRPAGLGVRLVVVIGARLQINQAMRAAGVEPRYAHGCRVTDAATMQAAIQAAGHARMEVESRLSKVGGLCKECPNCPYLFCLISRPQPLCLCLVAAC